MYMLVVAFMVQLLHLRYPLGGLHEARMVVVEKNQFPSSLFPYFRAHEIKTLLIQLTSYNFRLRKMQKFLTCVIID